MQRLGLEIIETARSEKIRKLEGVMREVLSGSQNGQMIECFFCHYVSKNKRFSAKVFDQRDGTKAFKCFACGIWRRL